jgi:hypothetical protein
LLFFGLFDKWPALSFFYKILEFEFGSAALIPACLALPGTLSA